MDFDFSDDQEQLRDAVRRWVDKSCSFERRRAVAKTGGFDRALWQEMAELGLTGLTIGEAFGGMNMGPVESMIVNEELGRGIVLAPYQAVMNAALILELYGPEALQANWLPRIASGEAIVTLATQERGARYNLTHCQTTAQAQGQAFVLSGQKDLVHAAAVADAWVVSAQLAGQIALFLVRPGVGVRVQAYALQDGTGAGSVMLEQAPAELLCSAGGPGLSALQMAQDCGVADACAYAVGAMEQTLALTVDYLNTRKQFGVAIASFQALRHRVADMKMQLELARGMSYLAHLRMLDEPAVRSRACSQAKVQLGQSMRKVGQEAIQLHGGIAMTDEYIVGHYFKVLTQLEMGFGDTLHHLGLVSEGMQETAGVFA
jgi:alkylation response protein AidB-like acyl-CoA dehydrogenase